MEYLDHPTTIPVKKVYTSLDEVKQDLRQLKLQREIAVEEMRLQYLKTNRNLKTKLFFRLGSTVIKKLGTAFILKKLFNSTK